MSGNGLAIQGHALGIAGAQLRPAERVDTSTRFDAEQRRLILETCCGGANESEARALLAIAEARGLNPLLGECYFVKRYDRETRRDKWAVQAAIDSLRIKAEQTGLYNGQDEPEYEYDDKGRITLARVRVWRKDWQRPCVGVARWAEYVQTTREGTPTRFWAQMPHNQLAKCAEALALRKAFPAVLAKVYVAEEMAQADNEVPAELVASPPKHLPPKPIAAPVQVDEQAYDRLCQVVDSAETTAALNTAAKDAARMHKAGALSDAHLESLKRGVQRKRALLGKPAPPPSAPDLDDSAEAEGDVHAAQYDGEG